VGCLLLNKKYAPVMAIAAAPAASAATSFLSNLFIAVEYFIIVLGACFCTDFKYEYPILKF